ncbi:hypothetical protein ABZ864_25110 [Streptomyces sp. NPDC047082]|uniref:hypothetical protein n=1 Tax=Streptomyces sp. NPDC047082 TaxID=3155259 RepID=UPI0034031F9B
MAMESVWDDDALRQVLTIVTLRGFEVRQPEPLELPVEIADLLAVHEASRCSLGGTEFAAPFQDSTQQLPGSPSAPQLVGDLVD